MSSTRSRLQLTGAYAATSLKFELCARLAMKHEIGLTRQAISQHLEVLETAGLLKSVRDGKYKMHYVETAPLRAIVQRWLARGKGGGRR